MLLLSVRRLSAAATPPSAPSAVLVETATPALAPCAASHVHYELPLLLPWTMAAGSKTRMPMCKSWENLKGRQQHTQLKLQLQQLKLQQQQQQWHIKKNLKNGIARSCCWKQRFAALSSRAWSAWVCASSVCASVCASMGECVCRKPLDKNVQLQRESAGYAHCCHCPKVDTMWAPMISYCDFNTLSPAGGATAKPKKWGMM